MPEPSRHPLHEAAASGDTGTVSRLLSEGLDVDNRDGDDGTALMLAAEVGHSQIVRLLLECGADVNAADNFQATALMLASHRGHVDSVRLLLAAGANVYARNRSGRSALDSATTRDNGEIRHLLEEAGANAGIVEAALQGDSGKVAAFLASGEPVDYPNATGLTPLMAAVAKGNIELATLLHCQGADLTHADRDGDMAFHHAVRHASRSRETALLRLMLDWGADVNGRGSRGAVPACHALYPECSEVLRFLLDNGADILEPADDSEMTLLMRAIHSDYSDLQTVELLLDYGADIDGRDKLDMTPLMHAVRLRPERDNVKFQQAAARIRNVPYVKRDSQHRLGLVRFLVTRDADVNACSHRGSVLSHASESSDVELVRFLLDAGTDVGSLGGTPPVWRANVSGSREVEALLRERGAVDADLVEVDPIVREALSRSLIEVSEPPLFRGWLVDRMNAAFQRKKEGK